MLSPIARRLALLLAAVAILSCASLIVFFAVGGWLGTINDIGNALFAMLWVALAVAVNSVGSRLAILTVLGAAIVAVGSVLGLMGTTGHFLAGLVSAFGFGFIGLWLLMTARAHAVPRPQLAMAAGLVMALGLIDIAGIVRGIDDQSAAPAWLVGAGICWAGTYLLTPAWALSAARSKQ